MKRTTVYLSDENLKQLAEEVERTGEKSAVIIRTALEWYFAFRGIKLTRFIPIDVDTEQDAVAKRLAQLIADSGVEGSLALPTAIGILAGIQSAINSGSIMSAVQSWDKDKRDEEEFWLRHHPKSKTARAIRKQRRERGDQNNEQQ